jgi:PAS domain S-box-containing protein
VIVLDARLRVAIANPAAVEICGLPDRYAGTTLDELPPEWAALFRRHATASSLREETAIGEGRNRRVYDLTLSPLPGHRSHQQRRLFLLHDITERQRTEAALRQLSQAVAQAPTPIVVTDVSGAITFVNPAFERITGYSATEVLGQNPRVLKSDHHPHSFYAELWATICSGKTWHGEFLNRKADGALYWEKAAIAPVTDSAGTITHFVAVKEDITARKAAEAQLRDSEARYRQLADSILDVVWILDLDTRRFRYVSPSVERLRGYTVDEVLGQDMSEVMTPASLAQLEQAIPAALAHFHETGSSTHIQEIEQTRRDGTSVWTEATARVLRNPESGRIEVFGVSRDISDRKRAEAEIARTQARLQSLVSILQHRSPSVQEYLDQALNEAIMLTESTIGYIYFYNDEKREFTLNTWSNGVMDACSVRKPETVYQLDKTGIWGEAVRQRKPIILNDFQASHSLKRGYPEGHVPLTRFMTLPVIQGDRIVAVVGLANKAAPYNDTDVLQIALLLETVWSVLDAYRAEEALQRYARQLEVQNQELDAFAHTVAHDLRGSLGGISGAAQLLQMSEQELSPDNLFATELLTWSVDKLTAIIDELMLLSGVRKQVVTPVPLDMARIVEEARRRLSDQIERTGATLVLPDSDAWPVALGHGAWVEEVWTNYLSNALKYGGTRPRITLGASAQADGSARFWMHNTGPAISPEDRGRLFVPFARLDQVRTQGDGLGLSIVQRIIEKLGGQVGVESENSDGNTFYFTLPLAELFDHGIHGIH